MCMALGINCYQLTGQTCVSGAMTGLLLFLGLYNQVTDAWFRQNLTDAMRQDEKVDRKIARNQNQFEALDFNAAVSDTRMSPASAFVATIRGNAYCTTYWGHADSRSF